MTSVSPCRPQLSRHGLFIRYVASFLIAALLAVCALSARSNVAKGEKVPGNLDVAGRSAVKRPLLDEPAN